MNGVQIFNGVKAASVEAGGIHGAGSLSVSGTASVSTGSGSDDQRQSASSPKETPRCTLRDGSGAPEHAGDRRDRRNLPGRDRRAESGNAADNIGRGGRGSSRNRRPRPSSVLTPATSRRMDRARGWSSRRHQVTVSDSRLISGQLRNPRRSILGHRRASGLLVLRRTFVAGAGRGARGARASSTGNVDARLLGGPRGRRRGLRVEDGSAQRAAADGLRLDDRRRRSGILIEAAGEARCRNQATAAKPAPRQRLGSRARSSSSARPAIRARRPSCRRHAPTRRCPARSRRRAAARARSVPQRGRRNAEVNRAVDACSRNRCRNELRRPRARSTAFPPAAVGLPFGLTPSATDLAGNPASSTATATASRSRTRARSSCRGMPPRAQPWPPAEPLTA